MNLTLTRKITANGVVIGELTGLGKQIFTLEQEWRNNLVNESCIPPGTYEVVPHAWEEETVFKMRQTYELQNVPARLGILIHVGNSAKDTHGCILVGFGVMSDDIASGITKSQAAMNYLRQKISQTSFTLTVQ